MKNLFLVMIFFAVALMTPLKNNAIAGETAAPIVLAGLQTGQADAAPRTAKPAGTYQEAQRRRRGVRRGRRGRRGRNLGVGIAAGIAGAIALGAIASANASRVSRDEYDWERCDDRYRSFRWSDGTFQPYGGGPRQLCPYLY